MYVTESRCEPIEEATTPRCAANSAFLSGESRWRWRHHFPHQGTSMLRVRSQQTLQHAGTAPRQPYDKEWFADFLACDIGISLSVPFHPQTRAQRLQDIDPQSNLSDQTEPRLAVAGLDQARESFKKIAVTEIVQAAAPLCSLDQINCMRAAEWNSRFFQQYPTSIEEPNGQQRPDLLESSGRGVHWVKASIVPAVRSITINLMVMETRPVVPSQAANHNSAWLRGASNRIIISHANGESHIRRRLFLGG